MGAAFYEVGAGTDDVEDALQVASFECYHVATPLAQFRLAWY